MNLQVSERTVSGTRLASLVRQFHFMQDHRLPYRTIIEGGTR